MQQPDPSSSPTIATPSQPSNRVARELRPLLKMCLLVAIVVGSLLIVYTTPLRGLLALDQTPRWRAMIQQTGPFGHLVFIASGALLVSLGFPRLAYSAIGGALYGFLVGALLSQIGAVLGSTVCFIAARRLGREWVRKKTHRRFARLEEHMRQRAFAIILLARLSPVGNTFLVNCVAATSSIPLRSFFIATFLGYIPQTAIFALLGSGLAKARHMQTTVSLVSFLVMGIVFVIYFRHARLGVTVADDLADTAESGVDEQSPEV